MVVPLIICSTLLIFTLIIILQKKKYMKFYNFFIFCLSKLICMIFSWGSFKKEYTVFHFIFNHKEC